MTAVPPQVNATVTALHDDSAASGGRDDWDTPGTEPTGGAAVKWTGSVGAYFAEDIERVPGPDGSDLVETRSLYVTSEWARAVELDHGDTITIVTAGGTTVRGRARLIAIRELAQIPASLQTARIVLEIT